MLRAMIFDCDGVIADNEPLHLRMFQKVLGEEGIPLSRKEYYETYLGMDDKGCFEAALQAHGRSVSPGIIDRLIEKKARIYEEAIRQEFIVFPGVVSLVQRASKQVPLAVASGALRREIEMILSSAGIDKAFAVIVSAEDVSEGKPHPEGFQKALLQLNALSPAPKPPIRTEDCLVVEDSIAGVQAAKAAGMRCLAVTNSYEAEELKQADTVVSTLEGLAIETLERLF